MHVTTNIPMPRRRPGALALLTGGALALPCAFALAAGPYAYVPSYYEDSVSAVDLSDITAMPTTFTHLLDDPTQHNPAFYGVAFSAADGMLWLSADYDNSVYQVDTATGMTVRVHDQVGTNPEGIAVDAGGRHVYVANRSSQSMSVIDTETQVVTDVNFSLTGLSAYPNPVGIALNLAGTRAYVTDTSVNHRLCRINLVTLPSSVGGTDCVQVGDNDSANPTAVAVSPDGSRAYVSIHGSGSSIAVVDTASMSVIRTFPLGAAGPNGIAVSASGKRGYVGTVNGKIISLDLTRVDDPAADPVLHVIEDTAVASVQGVSISQDGTRLLAADNVTSELHVVNIVNDADVVIGSVPVVRGPYAVGQFTARDSIFVGSFEKGG